MRLLPDEPLQDAQVAYSRTIYESGHAVGEEQKEACILWADDNAVNTEGANTIDTFSVTATVPTNIVITRQPEPAVVPPGSPASFEVIAFGAHPLRYQWRKDEVPLEGATNAVFSIGATAPADLGS